MDGKRERRRRNVRLVATFGHEKGLHAERIRRDPNLVAVGVVRDESELAVTVVDARRQGPGGVDNADRDGPGRSTALDVRRSAGGDHLRGHDPTATKRDVALAPASKRFVFRGKPVEIAFGQPLGAVVPHYRYETCHPAGNVSSIRTHVGRPSRFARSTSDREGELEHRELCNLICG
ncbi:MAG: hypothetical protein M3327_02925 [Actinomycetota bacterium]|nr:hypothetical protein [Actinomycetota bacterium]